MIFSSPITSVLVYLGFYRQNQKNYHPTPFSYIFASYPHTTFKGFLILISSWEPHLKYNSRILNGSFGLSEGPRGLSLSRKNILRDLPSLPGPLREKAAAAAGHNAFPNIEDFALYDVNSGRRDLARSVGCHCPAVMYFPLILTHHYAKVAKLVQILNSLLVKPAESL